MARRTGWVLDPGTQFLDSRSVKFRVWAPSSRKVDLVLFRDGEERVRMDAERFGYHSKTVAAEDGLRYAYSLGGGVARPDPASRHQPSGVHGPSELVDPHAFTWSDSRWKGIPRDELLIYEAHVGTCTAAGTFEAMIANLEYLARDLGVTALELMPVAQFPGNRNWGYDGVCMYAPQESYGGPLGLKKLVDRCHRSGLAVLLDVVYNHLGPEGNYLREFGPYFSHRYTTPWGEAINYDDSGCDGVRRFVVNNALYWIVEYHLDGLRLDAIHGIFDFSPKHILTEIGEAVHATEPSLGRRLHVIAESDLNDPRVVRPRAAGGYELDAQWADDFHHAVHAYLTGERGGYYEDFGKLTDVATALRSAFVYDGRYSVFRGRSHGASSKDVPPDRFVVFLQNHDQVGNRPDGLRLSRLVGPSALKAAAALLLLSPHVPLLFMGEEYAETAPFHYFISHTDPELVEAVRRGRKKDLAAQNWTNPSDDPYAESTFQSSKLHPRQREAKGNSDILRHYRELIRLRREHAALRSTDKTNMEVRAFEEKGVLQVRRWKPGVEELLMYFVLGGESATVDLPPGEWKEIYSSEGGRGGGRRNGERRGVGLPPQSATVFSAEGGARRLDSRVGRRR